MKLLQQRYPDKLELRVSSCAHRTAGRRSLRLVLILALGLTGHRALSQTKPTALSPSEAYTLALAPFNAARAQQDDLTEADKFALGNGMGQASRDCLALSENTSAFRTDGKQLIALGKLCLFGQRYEPARVALVNYLALQEHPERKSALLLLVQALLGLNEPDSAEPQVRSLLHDYNYDAEIHFAIDQVIDSAEGVNAFLNERALQLCETQNAFTLPLLLGGRALGGREASASASVLFSDAVRCVALAKELGKPWQDVMQQLTAIARQPSWVGTADLARMQAALGRQQIVGGRVPLASLHTHVLSNSTLAPGVVPLTRTTLVLVPFTLWSPSAPEVVRVLATTAPQQHIYAITSWSANTGREDAPSPEILKALNLWRQTLPPHASMLIVPEAELKALHADSFPTGIVIRDGVVRSNSVLSSQGAERMLLRTLTGPSEKP